jgi:hypothetical protein
MFVSWACLAMTHFIVKIWRRVNCAYVWLRARVHWFTIYVRKSTIKAMTHFDTASCSYFMPSASVPVSFSRSAKFVVSWYMTYHHVWGKKCTKCSAHCSWLAQFGCCQWCSLSCTRDESSLLAIPLSPYLVPRVFRIYVILSLRGLYVLYRSIQSNSSAGNSYHPPETGEPADWTTCGNSVLLNWQSPQLSNFVFEREKAVKPTATGIWYIS